MINLPATRENRSFAAAVTDKLAADARKVAGQAALWRSGGFALRVAGAGAGIGMVLLGASFLIDALSAKQREAETLAVLERQNRDDRAALQRQFHEELAALLGSTTIKTVGTVTGELGMKPDAVVGLKDGLVKLAPDSTVHLDRDSTVTTHVVQHVAADVPRPSPDQLQQSAAPASQAAAVTNFTIFKTVAFGNGEIQTGWQFENSEQKSPSSQYCLYVWPTNNGQRAFVTIGQDRMPVPGKPFADTTTMRAAFASCVWFSGAAKDAPPPPPANIIRARNG